MIRAGAMNELHPDAGDWVFADIGFAQTKASCGFVAINGSTPAVANGVVYVGSTDGNLYAFQAATGQKIWSAPAGAATGNWVASSPAVANGVVYVGSLD